MRISEKRKAGEILRRGGISSRIIELARDISEGTYKGAIEKAGQIRELVDAASFDDYWTEKAAIGIRREQGILASIVSGEISRESALSQSDPRKRVASNEVSAND
ncbi:hypothetical protein [Marinobacter alexandrii]|uniref:hypothetical protein n=1 Tax=Marinobacter alexandrii TaxID=2570351 RepID=UPI0011099281|nr:hypothetical protein [Marinobacter alexandrii]